MRRWDLYPHHRIKCTPNRQSISFLYQSRPNEVVTETTVLVDVVPAGSWACTKTIQRSKRFRRFSSYQDVVRTKQLDSQRHRWESNPLETALQAAALPSGSSATSFSVLARSRTWSSTFAGSRAIRNTPRTCISSAPRRGIEPRPAVSRTAMLFRHTRRAFIPMSRPGLEPGSGPSEGPMRSIAPSRPSASRPGVEPGLGP